jgi:hypothetical protein
MGRINGFGIMGLLTVITTVDRSVADSQEAGRHATPQGRATPCSVRFNITGVQH